MVWLTSWELKHSSDTWSLLYRFTLLFCDLRPSDFLYCIFFLLPQCLPPHPPPRPQTRHLLPHHGRHVCRAPTTPCVCSIYSTHTCTLSLTSSINLTPNLCVVVCYYSILLKCYAVVILICCAVPSACLFYTTACYGYLGGVGDLDFGVAAVDPQERTRQTRRMKRKAYYTGWRRWTIHLNHIDHRLTTSSY